MLDEVHARAPVVVKSAVFAVGGDAAIALGGAVEVVDLDPPDFLGALDEFDGIGLSGDDDRPELGVGPAGVDALFPQMVVRRARWAGVRSMPWAGKRSISRSLATESWTNTWKGW
ncbi:MAG: hypothetical protein AB1679_00455 [Actinomycetota bacterium]